MMEEVRKASLVKTQGTKFSQAKSKMVEAAVGSDSDEDNQFKITEEKKIKLIPIDSKEKK